MSVLRGWRAGAAVLVAASVATAQPAAPVPDEAAQHLAEAKALFRQGNELRKIGDFQRALDFYERSRALVPSVPNTLDAAVCLQALGRNAEALELYETLLTQFSDKLGKEDKAAIAAATKQLRPKVASVEISANVSGIVVIDGRTRGKVPMQSPVRVMPGEHTVRVLKDGFATYEKTVKLRAGQTVRLDARLSALGVSGKLRIEGPSLAGADLYVDGALIGKLPWEGVLAPGQHIYYVKKGDIGTAPALATVVDGQTVLVEARAKPLGREVRILLDPPDAPLSLDGVPVGKGGWQGRLPLGTHVAEAREEGYYPGRFKVSITSEITGDIPLSLKINPDHPRWAHAHGHFYVEAFGGYGLSNSLHSDAESYCGQGQCSRNGGVTGFVLGARGGYELPIHLAMEISGGFLDLATSVQRHIDDSFTAQGTTVPVRYTYKDDISLAGPFVALGLAYHLRFGRHLGVDVRTDVGAVLARTRDRINARAATTTESAAAVVENAGAPVTSAALLVMPSARLLWAFGGFNVGAGLAVPVFPLSGPRNNNGRTQVEVQGNCGPPQSVTCAPLKRLIASERAYGSFFLVVPTISAGYSF